MFFILSEVFQPINCVLISEDVPSITIVLSERTENSLKGKIFNNKLLIGKFYTRKPNQENSANWSFESSNVNLNGEIILFKDNQIWHQYQNKVKANQVNRALFSSLSMKLSKITNDTDLLKGTSGFFTIGNQCYGGKIDKALYKTKKDSLVVL